MLLVNCNSLAILRRHVRLPLRTVFVLGNSDLATVGIQSKGTFVATVKDVTHNRAVWSGDFRLEKDTVCLVLDKIRPTTGECWSHGVTILVINVITRSTGLLVLWHLLIDYLILQSRDLVNLGHHPPSFFLFCHLATWVSYFNCLVRCLWSILRSSGIKLRLDPYEIKKDSLLILRKLSIQLCFSIYEGIHQSKTLRVAVFSQWHRLMLSVIIGSAARL